METIVELNESNIKDKIYTIRGVKVMLDFELAEIYGYSTKRFNEQVRNNIDKFPSDFMFQLTKEETEKLLRSKKSTIKNGRGQHSKYLPYVFTEQGIYMLMTVLKGPLAVQQSKTIVRLFKTMKDYIIESSQGLVPLVRQVENNSARLDKIESKIEVVMDNFIDPTKYKEIAIFEGNRIESDIIYQEIYTQADKTIFLIDNYVDIKTLKLLKAIKSSVEVIIFTDKNRNKIEPEYLEDFIKDTKEDIKIKSGKGLFHDRYIILDYKTSKEKMYHCGFSSKDGGNKVGMIQIVEHSNIYHELINELLK